MKNTPITNSKPRVPATEEGLKRVLTEFPCLWAVSSSWCHHFDNVLVQSADEKIFRRRAQPFCWIMSYDIYNRGYSVTEMMVTGDHQTMAQLIQEKLTMHSETEVLQLVVVRDRSIPAWSKEVEMPSNPALRRFYQYYTVFRAPNGCTIHALLERVIREDGLRKLRV